MSEFSTEVSWTTQLEDHFASTGEKANCLSWIHKKAEEVYATRRTWIDLPVIAISSITGFLSVGATQMFGEGSQMEVSVALGLCSLLVSVLNTTGTYFGWAKRAEGHRISSIQYARLFRFLSIELALPREERMTPNDLLKHVQDQYDRLQETSPLVPPEIIALFQRRFKDYKDVRKPSEANGLEKIVVYPLSETPPLKTTNPLSGSKSDASLGTPSVSSPTLPRHRSGLDSEPMPPLRQNPLFEAAKTSPAQVGLTIAPSNE